MKNKRKYRIFKDMHFVQRLILIYVIGGIIPLIAVSLYTNQQTQKMMLELKKESQTEELSLLGTSVYESMSVLDTVARRISLNTSIKKIAQKNYKTALEFHRDLRNLNVISDYLFFYKQDIQDIQLYIDNSSIQDEDIKKYKNVFKLDNVTQKKEWYKKTVQNKNKGVWFFGGEDGLGNNTIQISRTVCDKDNNVIGAVVVFMQYSKTSEALSKRNTDCVIYYNDSVVVCSNYDTTSNYPFLIGRISKLKKDKMSQKMINGVEEYMVYSQRIYPMDCEDYYTIVSVQKYSEIMAAVNTITVRALIPEIICMIASGLFIMAFAISYTNRMNQLKLQMQRVAQGEYEKVEPVEGNDEIGVLYREVEQMIKDIQMLMKRVVDEKVQREKLHTRQKEVEFKMLASQINPHFLYNTLETIRMKAVVNKQKEIVDLVKMLAKTMRYNIQVTDQLVPLKSEMEMVEYYLKIQEYRFGDRIRSSIDIDSSVEMNTLTMPLIVQPFVENAFVHGLEAMESGELKVKVFCKDQTIYITIEDNGVGMDYYQLGQVRKRLGEENVDQTHIGMRNVNQRIKISYGEEYGVFVESNKGKGTKITIKFPSQTENDSNV